MSMRSVGDSASSYYSYYGGDGDSKWTYYLMVFSLILFITLVVFVGLYCHSKNCGCENFESFLNVTNENIKSKIMGGKHFKALQPNENVVEELQKCGNGRKVLIAVLADWCGYCKQLKKSGELAKVAKKSPVIELNDKHPQSQEIMKNVGSKGFPTLIIFGGGEFKLYDGPREHQSILQELSK